MPLTAEERQFIHDAIAFVYADLWGHYRALLSALGDAGLIVAEHFETDAQVWLEAHRAEVSREALAKLREFFRTGPGAPPRPDPSPPAA